KFAGRHLQISRQGLGIGIVWVDEEPNDVGRGDELMQQLQPLWSDFHVQVVTPVTLPPGRLRLATQPSCTGSRLVVKTMGIAVVAALAGNVAALFAAITSTLRRTKSAASAGKRFSVHARADRPADRKNPVLSP